MLCKTLPGQGGCGSGEAPQHGAGHWWQLPTRTGEQEQGGSSGRTWRALPGECRGGGSVCCSSGSLEVSRDQVWRTCLAVTPSAGGELGISLFVALLFDLVALSFPCLISYIFEVYCDEIWLYLSYKGFWCSLGSSLWRKIVGSGCQSSGWPRSLLYLVFK